ncbi:MAG: entericidin A/B family lipoprotein [Desulfuromonas sp.]|nr:entericidin A/B family lipoprotein [Desulfuromonas sp.]
MKRFCSLILLIVTLVILAGCNTTAGFGRDVEKAGNWIEEKAAD